MSDFQAGQKTSSKTLKDFDIPMGSWEQTALELAKWRGLINKGAALYKKKENAQRTQSQ